MAKVKNALVQLADLLQDPAHNTHEIDSIVITTLLKAYTDLPQFTDAAKLPLPEGAIAGFLKALELKDTLMYHHSIRTAKYAAMMAEWLGCKSEEARDVVLVSLLHDIGKIGVPDDILKSTGQLELKAFEQMKKHAQLSGELLKTVTAYSPLIDGTVHHHERVDGFGYPDGLSGTAISLPARVCLIVDTFDAMTSNRPYRVALPISDTLSEIKRNAGKQFDKDLANLFVDQMQAKITSIETELGIDQLPKISRAA